MKLQHKTILITGATSGLGRGMALALASGSNVLVVTGRREALLETLRAEIEARGSRCITAAVDATDTKAVAAHLADVIASVGRIDVAILNAGGSKPHVMGTPDASAEELLGNMARNYGSLVNYLCPLIDHMRGHDSTIAYTSSPAGFFGLPKSGGYSAAKAAGRTLLDSARVELGQSGIRFVTLYPGFTYTDSMDPDAVPFKWLILQPERAVREMLWAIEKGRSHHIFPRRIAWPIRLGRLLPEPLRRRVLQLVK